MHNEGWEDAMSKIDDIAEQLGTLNLQIKHDMEQAEAKVERVNGLVRELGTTGLLSRRVILGPDYTHPWDPGCGPQDSAQVVQAALLVPEGFGVCLWSTDEFLEFEQSPGGLEQHARKKFEPFEKCCSADKKFLLPFVEEMLEDLTDVALVAASKLELQPRITADDYFAQRSKNAERKPGA
jgi:hypothetical protein